MTCPRCDKVTNRQLAAVARGAVSVGPLEANIFGELRYKNDIMPNVSPAVTRLLIALLWRYPYYVSYKMMDSPNRLALRNTVSTARRFLDSWVPEVKIELARTAGQSLYKLVYLGEESE